MSKFVFGFAFDHDGSIGQFAHSFTKGYHINPEKADSKLALLREFFNELIRETLTNIASPSEAAADLPTVQIYSYIASLRQDLNSDRHNILNKYDFLEPERRAVVYSGSIFLFKEVVDLLNKLIEVPGWQVKIDPDNLVTADLFPEYWRLQGKRFRPGLYLTHPRICAKATRYLDIFNSLPGAEYFNDYDGVKPGSFAALDESIEHHTLCDHGKFLNTWIQIQELANKHPDKPIKFIYFDDFETYGNELLAFFNDHPELIPENVEFIAYKLVVENIYIDSYDPTQTKKIGAVKGVGPIHPAYYEEARQLSLTILNNIATLAEAIPTFNELPNFLQAMQVFPELLEKLGISSSAKTEKVTPSVPPGALDEDEDRVCVGKKSAMMTAEIDAAFLAKILADLQTSKAVGEGAAASFATESPASVTSAAIARTPTPTFFPTDPIKAALYRQLAASLTATKITTDFSGLHAARTASSAKRSALFLPIIIDEEPEIINKEEADGYTP